MYGVGASYTVYLPVPKMYRKWHNAAVVPIKIKANKNIININFVIENAKCL